MTLLLQAAGAVPTSAKELILHASTATQVVLVILVVLSLVSWAIMLGVGRELTRALRASTEFAREVERAGSLDSVGVSVKHASPSASHRLLVRALQFIGATTRPDGGGDAIVQLSPTAAASRVETLRLVMDAESLGERDRLGRFLPWLATIGSASPLIGLLGTVLGIISAFVGIATTGSGNLAAVAPGVAEALVATAAALSVAIPATFGYNILANRLNRLDNLLEGFGTTVIALLVREGRI
ncbi:MAG TPA: MotA/TolQ/ExbB proton channel family protein [Gemmatimonadaceae bacterium]|nr:MotA/TolQ/ExbB proton channel family protein [Gemmatimonadaceae bacterium]